MLKIFLYLIEGFIIGYFDFKFIKKDFNYYLISFFSIIFTLSHVIAEQYLVYDYLSIVITIAILYLMNGLDNKIDKTKNLFISTFIGIVICMFDSMSILKIIFVLKTGSEGVLYSQDIVYYIILVVTRLMIFITLYLLDKKQIFKQLIISNKYLTLLTSISLVNCFLLNRCGKESWSLSRRVLAKKFHCSALTISRAIRQLKECNLIDAVPDYDRQGINRFRALSLHERVARLKRQHSRTMLFFYQMHKLVLERKRQRTAALKRRYAYSLFAAPLSSMHLLFPIPRCFISKERKNKSLPLAKSNSLMGLLRRKAMDRARSPMVEFSG